MEQRHGIISKEAWLVDPGWLKTGHDLWEEHAAFPRDYFLAQPGSGSTVVNRELGYVEYAGRARQVLSHLGDGHGQKVGDVFATFIRPHSWRSFLTSAATAMGAPAGELKWLSAWKAQGAEAYVRTSRQRTAIIQTTVARLLKLHLDQKDPTGERALLDLATHHLSERGCTEEEVARVINVLRVFPGDSVVEPLWHQVTEERFPKGEQDSGGTASGSAQSGPAAKTRRIEVSDTSEDETRVSRVQGYVISISRRRGGRRLHKIGLCDRRPGVHYKDFLLKGATRPPPEDYDEYCRDCWREGVEPRGRESTSMGLGSDTGSSRRTSSSSSTSSSPAVEN